jgi:hypothetical protein
MSAANRSQRSRRDVTSFVTSVRCKEARPFDTLGRIQSLHVAPLQ